MVDRLNFSYYQAYLQAGIENLESYLLSDNLYGNLGVSSQVVQNYPQLTLGGLLLYKIFTNSLIETKFQQSSFRKLEIKLDALQTRWRVAWNGKAAWEFQSRLRQWGLVLSEIRDEPHENIPYYRYEVRTRAMISLLLPEISEIDPANLEQLENQDLLLRMLLDSDDFIWDAALAPAFPKDHYWYLWGLPKEN
jgi:hypothetical protein